MTLLSSINPYLWDTIIILFWTSLIADVLCLVLNIKYYFSKSHIVLCTVKVILSISIVSLMLCNSSEYVNVIEKDKYLLWMANIPLWIILLVLVIDVGLSVFGLTKCFINQKHHLSARSIKESLDNLPTGLCFYEESGQPLLVNNAMQEDCILITGYALLNGKNFWNKLSSEKFIDDCLIIKQGNNPIIKTPNGKVKSFLQTEHLFNNKVIYELTSSDITNEYCLSEELKDKNMQLKLMNKRLRDYSERITSYTREKEILSAKIRIHDEIGKLLISSQRSLVDNRGRKELIDAWIQTSTLFATVMKKEETSTDALQEIIQTGKDLGVNVNYTGSCPPKGSLEERIITNAIHECLTNTIVHANGDELQVEFRENQYSYIAVFKNNGTSPNGEIAEGGGLSSLRKLVEKQNGKMCITSFPNFILTIELKKRRYKNDDK